jgi:glycosyltransferase involved in cell wall biosynthesis
VSTVLVISFSDLGADPRVDRQIAALRERHDVIAAGLGAPRDPEVRFVDLTPPARTAPGKALGLARLLAHRHLNVFWRHPANRHAAELLAGVRCDVVVANDVPALPLACELPARPPVVFDAHEYAPAEQAEQRWWRIVIAPYVRTLCAHYLPHVAGMMTVGPLIAEAYERDFGVRPAVVYNAPPLADLEPSPVGETIRVLHHGVAQRGRRLEVMLDVLERLEERFTLDLVLAEGTPGYRDELVARAEALPRARVLPPRPMPELVAAANAYDVGLYLLPPSSLNYAWAMPNKLFEFIQARLAIAIGPSPEMAALVERYQCGVVAADFEPASLAAALNRLSPDDVAQLKRRAAVAAQDLSQERARATILDLVERAARSSP